jgi:hypothetical protein
MNQRGSRKKERDRSPTATRTRQSDVLPLAEYFLARYAKRNQIVTVRTLIQAHEAERRMCATKPSTNTFQHLSHRSV